MEDTDRSQGNKLQNIYLVVLGIEMIFNVIGVAELLKDRGKIKRWLKIES